MLGNLTPYVVAVIMIGFCALSAFILITAANHFDAGEGGQPERHEGPKGYNVPAPK